MPGVKISDLPAADAALGPMQIEVNDAGVSRRVTVGQARAGLVQSDSVTSIVSLSQAAYDALPTKDAATLYAITG
jgi:hypothetical protein